MNRYKGLFLLCILAQSFLYSLHAQTKKFAPLPFRLHWKAAIGSASFRTNVVLDSNRLFIGSNGEQFMDMNLIDKKSGVYVIDRKKGKIQKKIGGEPLGDMDVNGVLLYKGYLYFGNDNEEFICSDTKGTILWRNPASGDIEHEPILLNLKGKDVIVYASEAGEVRAVNPLNGKSVWTYLTPDFNGWKPGDNRTIYKVKAYFSNTQSFFTKPLLADLNRDGVQDLMYCTYDRKVVAINGKNGKLLWTNEDPLLTYLTCLLPAKNNTVFYGLGSLVDKKYNSTHYLFALNTKGNIIFRKKLPDAFESSGLNAITSGDKMVMATRNRILWVDSNGKYQPLNRTMRYLEKNFLGDTVLSFRNSYNPLLGTRSFSYKNHPNCILLMEQNDYANYEYGFVEIISEDLKKVVGRWRLPARSEMPPLIEDINGDGYLDLLVSCLDGTLYCYNLKTPVR